MSSDSFQTVIFLGVSMFGCGKARGACFSCSQFSSSAENIPYKTRMRFPECLLKGVKPQMEVKAAATVSQGCRQDCEIKDVFPFPSPSPF